MSKFPLKAEPANMKTLKVEVPLIVTCQKGRKRCPFHRTHHLREQ